MVVTAYVNNFWIFISTERITGEVLACNIKITLAKYALELKNSRGQGYDGSSNMSVRHGVQGILSRENGKALYIHCNSHIFDMMFSAAIHSKYEWYGY